MSRIGTAFRAFFGAMFNGATASRLQAALSNSANPALPSVPKESPTPAKPPAPSQPAKPRQNEAITLLAALQREARLIDFLMEDLSSYEDGQIGAVVREIHRDSRKVLDRLCPIQPIVTADEGSPCEVPAGAEDGRFRVTGKVSGTRPYQGVLRHHGWEATQCELPSWTGAASAANVLAPAEVELP